MEGLKDRVTRVLEELEGLENELDRDLGGMANIVFEKHDSGATIEGNRSGLLELARHVLMVASSISHHADIDEAEFASKSDGVLTICLNEHLR